MSDYGVVECPACSGEGHDFEVMIESSRPCLLICELCDGSGLIEQPVICELCKLLISGLDIDYSFSDYIELIEYNICASCRPKAFADSIVRVQPMTGQVGQIFYTSATSPNNTIAIANNGISIGNHSSWTWTA